MLLALALLGISSGLAPTAVEGAAPGFVLDHVGRWGGNCGRQLDEKGTAEADPGNNY